MPKEKLKTPKQCTCMMADVLKKVDVVLDKISNQNITICNILAEHNTNLKTALASVFESPKYMSLFPIATNEDFIEWEEMINDENKPAMIRAVKTTIGAGGLKKNFKLIIDEILLLQYNLEGIHDKKRLRNLPRVMEIFSNATMNENVPYNFENDIRKALKDIKNRHHKNACLKNKKLREELEKNKG